MKDRGTPVSLFSFQDIVTSLTGVMVIVILVIVLQLAEARYDYENPTSDNSEYLELKRKLKELTERIRRIKEMDEEISEELMAYINTSVESIDAQLQAEGKAAASMRAEKEKNEKEMVTIRLSLEQIQELLKAINEEKPEKEAKRDAVDAQLAAAESDEGNHTLERQLQTLLLENERLRNNIRITADQVEFSFVGVMSRQPILIECLGNGFRAQVYKSGEAVREFRGGGLSRNISGLATWLRQKNLRKCYPVLLLRRSFFPHLNELLAALYHLDEDIVLGMEPLDDKVKVF